MAPLVLLVAVLLAGCASAMAPAPTSPVLARVNGEPVTARDLDESFTATHRGHGVLLAGQGAVQEFLEKVIDRKLLAQEARRIGLDRAPEVVTARETLRARRAADALWEREVTRNVQVGEEAIAGAYERLRHRYAARHLVVATRDEAVRARERVAAGEPFGAVARAVSTAPTARRGGDLGIVHAGQLPPELEDQLWKLEANALSEPFQTEAGWNLLHAVERVAVEPPKPESARRQIVARLEQRARQRRAAEFIGELRTKHGATMHADVLAAALAPGAPAPAGAGPAVLEAGDAPLLTLGEALALVDPAKAAKLPPDKLAGEIRQLLEGELHRRLVAREGLARGLGDTAEVRAEIARATDAMILDLLVGTVILQKVSADDTRARAYYDANPGRFTEPEAVKLHALLARDDDEAQAALAELAAGRDFAAVARRGSRDPSLATSGGDLGWVPRGQLEPAVEAVAFGLAEGETAVARTQAGAFVVRVERKRPPRLRPFDEVAAEARERARREDSQGAIKGWVTKLREASAIVVDGAAITRAIADYEATAQEKAKKRR
jgi:peptidyl-prolyl cis-trans isomerase C